jgi:hypothetical protein
MEISKRPGAEESLPLFMGSPARQLVLALLGNTVIALFLTAVDGEPFVINFIYSQCIGLSLFGAVRLVLKLRGGSRYHLSDGLLGIPLGGLAGFFLGT